MSFRWWKQLFQTQTPADLLKNIQAEGGRASLKKSLRIWDLTAFGVAALVGAGVFSTIGNAAAQGGPAVVFLFLFTAIACAFSAFCYAEFAASLPIAGSSYSYAYASFGELLAWVMGWNLLLEYAISNIVVAISWSQYFCSFLSSYGIHFPPFLTRDYLSAWRGYQGVQALMIQQGISLESVQAQVSEALWKGYLAWSEAPRFAGVPLICDLPALGITIAITGLVYWGIQESKKVSNLLVFFKLLVIFLVIVLGSFAIQPEHWVPFAPKGISGVLKGVSAVFFAYIGFDAISSTAEECENPQRDIPRSMIYSLLICTAIYIVIALVLTGMMPFDQLGVGDPLALVFGPRGMNLPWMARLVEFSAVIALSSVLLVYQLGQPRIWMAMSRDGLLPALFSAIHPIRQIPWFSTLFTGVVVAIPTFFMNQEEVTDLASMGVLFAFSLVCGGILKRNPHGKRLAGSRHFVIPYVNSKWIFPLLVAISGGVLAFCFPEFLQPTSWTVDHLPVFFFSLFLGGLAYQSFRRAYSLIPVLGLTACGCLLAHLGWNNWVRFVIWMLAGLVIYFLYGRRHSKLRVTNDLKTD